MISVGIDVSKGKSTVWFFKPGGEVLRTPYDHPTYRRRNYEAYTGYSLV